MRVLPWLVALLLAGVVVAGCLSPRAPADEDPVVRFDEEARLFTVSLEVDGQALEFSWAPGAVGRVHNGGDAAVAFRLPDRFLDIQGEEGSKRFGPGGTVEVAPGAAVAFLAPPGAVDLVLPHRSGVHPFSVADAEGADNGTWVRAVDGENVWDLMAHQEAEFPNRMPGHENYGRAIAYFAQYFEELGYATEVDPYGTQDLSLDGLLCVPARGTMYCPESLANVVAWKPGTEEPDKVIFVGGAHFDMVIGTTHAAFDNTGGTTSVLELARALAPYSFRYTIMFGLWGGEENGLLGSNFWVQSNPDMRLRVLSHWNLDVVGMNWPAPLAGPPDPILVAAGPDVAGPEPGPVASDLLDWARTLQQDWLGFPDEVQDRSMFLYEGVAGGQVDGHAGVNAQSDHTAFIAAGIPSYFIFNGDALAPHQPVAIHSERDTLTNMTKYAYYGGEFDLDDPTWESPEVFQEARKALSDSFESIMWFPFYHAVLVDLGIYTPPAPAVTLPAAYPGPVTLSR